MFSPTVGREEHCKQVTLACAHSVSATLGLPPLMACVVSLHACLPCLGSRLLCQELSEASPGFYALPRSKLLRFRHLGSPQRCRLGWTCVPFPGLSSSGDQVFGKHSHCNLSPPQSLPLCFLGVQPAHLLRWMLTVQNPKKSCLAMKPGCSLVDDASLGPQLPPSGSGCPPCLSPEGDGPACSRLALLSPLFCEQAWRCLRLGLFAG